MKRYSRRMAGRSPSLAWLVVGFFVFILLSAMYSGVVSPPNRLVFGEIAVVSIVIIECTRRIARLW